MENSELKKMANNDLSWRERMKAVQELGKLESQSSGDILVRMAISDPVYSVREAAFRAAQNRNLTHKGKPVFLGKKQKGHLVKDIMKKLTVVRNKLDDECSLDDFKVMFLKLYPAAYDIYEGDKGKRFDKWLSNIIPTLKKTK